MSWIVIFIQRSGKKISVIMLVVHFCVEILGQERTRSDDRPFDQRHYPCKILCIHFCAEIFGAGTNYLLVPTAVHLINVAIFVKSSVSAQ